MYCTEVGVWGRCKIASAPSDSSNDSNECSSHSSKIKMLRTHTCGQLNEQDLDKEVSLCGWVDSRRDHGKIIFIDIRDRYGLTQIVFIKSVSKDAYQEAQGLKNEDVIKVRGKVSLRPKGTQNPKIPTGKIEVAVEELKFLSRSEEIPTA